MKAKGGFKEYDVIIKDGTVYVLTDIGEDLTLNGVDDFSYYYDDLMIYDGFKDLVGKKRIYAFTEGGLIGEYLID